MKQQKKQQAASKMLTCDICGKSVFARGLKSHVRLKHHLKVVTQVVTQVVEKSYSEDNQPTKLFTETIELNDREAYIDPRTSMDACIRLGLKYRKPL